MKAPPTSKPPSSRSSNSLSSHTARGILSGPEVRRHLTHLRQKPKPALTESVEHFWWVSWDRRDKAPLKIETLPHPCIHLVFDERRWLATGVCTRRFSKILSGQAHTFGVKFRPATFRAWQRLPRISFTAQQLPAAHVLAFDNQQLEQRLASATSFGECIAATEETLTPHAPALCPDTLLVRDCVEQLNADRTVIGPTNWRRVSVSPPEHCREDSQNGLASAPSLSFNATGYTKQLHS